ncbi:MAG: HAD family phosphatase [Lachnospiraceae bacterium]|nr:HAD family phosphatase [Lachnospiraceae bacterium]
MLNNIDAVIFDLDGTLIDSMWVWKQIDEDYLAEFGHKLPDDLQEILEGMSFNETAAYFQDRFGITDDIDTIKNTWNKMAWDYYEKKVPLKPGVFEFLNVLKKRNIKMGVATSNSPELVKMVLTNLNVINYFDAIHTSCEVEHGKPFPDIYLYVAEKLDVKPERCLVFEDILPGIQAGKAAGMKVCAVYDEVSHKELSVKVREADIYFRGFDEIMKCGNSVLY